MLKTLGKLKLRFIVQLSFFILVFLTAINHSAEAVKIQIPLISNASVHVICPFGAVVSFYKLIVTGTFVNKIHESAVVIFNATFILAVFFGPVFCGWVCPLGSIQEWIARLGKRLGIHGKLKLSRKTDLLLRNTRYALLIWIIYVTARSGQLIFTDYDPYYALFNFWSGEVAFSAMLILSATLVLALVIERPWCKYACPLGALLGISNLIRVFGIHRSENTCTSCQLCSKACPMGIEVANLKSIRNPQCISCYECTSEASCPVESTVQIRIGGVRHEN